MSNHVPTPNFYTKKNLVLVTILTISIPFLSYAGGLGIAAIMALCALFGLVGIWKLCPVSTLKNIPPAIWALMVFLLWAWVSQFWSPWHPKTALGNADKLLIGVPLYLGCAAMLAAQARLGAMFLPRILTGLVVLGMLAVIYDTLSGYSLTFLFKPPEPDGDINLRIGDTLQNLGHHVTVLAVLIPPLIVLNWQQGGRNRLASVILAPGLLAAGLVTGMNVVVIGVIIAALAMILTWRWPRLGLSLVFGLSGCAVLFAPVLGFIARQLGPDIRARLPFSWEERVATWGYMYDKIMAKPWIGYGFDAVRTFNDTHTIRGFKNRALVSLHPHNGGLHIWGETGLVGAVLACLALFLAWRNLAQPGRLSRAQSVGLSGLVIMATLISSLSYGVWQDWWWAIIIFAGAQITFIPANPHKYGEIKL